MQVDCSLIKRFREAKGWKPADFALAAGVTRQAVEQWEAGGVKSFRTLQKIAKVLEINPALLLINVDSQG